MAGVKSLAKDTVIYGSSSIIGRFLNWMLVPMYTYLFAPGEYGVVTYLYGVVAVLLVILNYGMETGFFRFANREDQDPETVYSTSMMSVGFTSLLFVVLLSVFLDPATHALQLEGYELFVWLMGVTVAIDAFTNIPFAYLRFRKKPVRFAVLKFVNIGLNIGLNLFFLLLCPWLMKTAPATIAWFYQPMGGFAFGIGWIFVANIISTICILLTLLPFIVHVKWRFDSTLLRSMLSYSWPLLILGVAGLLSQNMGQILIPQIFKQHPQEALDMVGIFGANMKIAVVMVMFTQAFRYAYEPFIFAQARSKGEDKTRAYCDAMKFFVIFGLFIFLGVMYFLPVLKHFVSQKYWAGLAVVPIMMVADIFFGVYFNLSIWYKLTDRTRWGMYFSLLGFVIMLGLNLWLVPMIGIPGGYIGCAWAALIAYAVIMVVSYLVGQHYYPIPYDLKTMGLYTLLAAAFFVGGMLLPEAGGGVRPWITYTARTALLLIYIVIVGAAEHVPVITPMVSRLLRRKGNNH